MEVLALAVIAFAIIGFQAFIFRRFAFKNLKYKCEFSINEAHEGDDIYLIETVYNGKLLPVPWLKAELNSSKWLDFAETRSVVAQENRYVTSSFFLKSHQKVIRRWKLKCIKRGVFHIDRVSLVSGDLLGNAIDSMGIDVNTYLKVYPRTIELEKTFIPVNHLQGDAIVRRWIMEDPFIVAGTREYTSSDPMNKIHWASTAHAGRLMVKREDYTSQNGTAVFLNIQSIENEYFDAVYKDYIELGIKAAATIFDTALRNGIPVRFATNGTTVDDGRQMIFTSQASGRSHISSLLGILAMLQLRRLKDFEDFLRDVHNDIVNSEVILITSYLTVPICDLLRRMKMKNNRVKIMVTNKTIEPHTLPHDMDVYILKEAVILDGE
ncbi:MAG TPA: DUF58 domain-containing protein [Clostridiales bacterium]|nr:DUF58 domain-containing protein [Clostridiales bacterium]